MVVCRITVLKRTVNHDLKGYWQDDPAPCPCFTEGQTFVAGFEKPAGFCDWAWNDLLRFTTALLTGGNFSSGIFDGVMTDDRTMIACCTDGMRPVVFKLERIDEE